MEEFLEGEKVQHIYTKKILWVLRIGREQILCRTEDLREIWFYRHELEKFSSVTESTRSSRRFL